MATEGEFIAGAFAKGAVLFHLDWLCHDAEFAYQALREYVARWASDQITELEKQAKDGGPTGAEEAELAAILDRQGPEDLITAQKMAQHLLDKISVSFTGAVFAGRAAPRAKTIKGPFIKGRVFFRVPHKMWKEVPELVELRLSADPSCRPSRSRIWKKASSSKATV